MQVINRLKDAGDIKSVILMPHIVRVDFANGEQELYSKLDKDKLRELQKQDGRGHIPSRAK